MNVYNWQEGKYIITFIVGNKYCVVASDHAGSEDEVFDAVKEWHHEVDPNSSMVPFVVVSEVFVTQAGFDWFIDNELVQAKVNV